MTTTPSPNAVTSTDTWHDITDAGAWDWHAARTRRTSRYHEDALAAVQSGLEKAEQVATAAAETKAKADQLLKVALGLVGLSILLLVISRRHPR
jgi:hypothetical protein